jgi:hypothetical protein
MGTKKSFSSVDTAIVESFFLQQKHIHKMGQFMITTKNVIVN